MDRLFETWLEASLQGRLGDGEWLEMQNTRVSAVSSREAVCAAQEDIRLLIYFATLSL